MAEKRSLSSEELSAHKRRQQYFRRRRLIAQMSDEGSRLVVRKMDDWQLWGTLHLSLMDVMGFARDHASPELMRASQDAWAAYHELRDRGAQLRLFGE